MQTLRAGMRGCGGGGRLLTLGALLALANRQGIHKGLGEGLGLGDGVLAGLRGGGDAADESAAHNRGIGMERHGADVVWRADPEAAGDWEGGHLAKPSHLAGDVGGLGLFTGKASPGKKIQES